MRKEEKAQILESISAQLAETPNFYITDISGLNAENTSKLRRECFEKNIKLVVVKNTLFHKALEALNSEEVAQVYPALEGPTAIAISKEDATAPARILFGFAKTADALQLKSGVVEGTYYDEKGIQVIATIPSREELLSKFLGSIQSPVTNFARVIKQIAEKSEAEA